MKNIFSCLLLILGFFALSSCDPSQDANGDFLNGVKYNFGSGATTSKTLKKMTSHMKDDTGAWEDTSITYTYTGNKLVSYKDESGITTKLEYNSNNKISKLSSSGETSVFEYSGANVSKVTTTITGAGKITSTFTYGNGKLSKAVSVQEYTLPLPLKLYVEASYEYQGENMVKSVAKGGAYDDTGTLIMDPGQKTITATYDTKKSPYKLLPAELIIYLEGIGSQGGLYLSANNFLKVTIAETGAAAKTQTFVHTYNGDYPTKSTAGEEYILYQY